MKEITFQLTDLECKLLSDNLRDPEEWTVHVATSRAHKYGKLLLRQEIERGYGSEAQTIPLTSAEILEAYFAQTGYKTRAELLEEEEAAERVADERYSANKSAAHDN